MPIYAHVLEKTHSLPHILHASPALHLGSSCGVAVPAKVSSESEVGRGPGHQHRA